ncbi:MAG: phage integrase N-terminal SAM-like domain-containing protein [Deltaproteobacteria bacterium]
MQKPTVWEELSATPPKAFIPCSLCAAQKSAAPWFTVSRIGVPAQQCRTAPPGKRLARTTFRLGECCTGALRQRPMAPSVDGYRRQPNSVGAREVSVFLSDQATRGNVSASTQNQALAALLFLYSEVLHRPLELVGGVVHAKRPMRLPVVRWARKVRWISELSGHILVGGVDARHEPPFPSPPLSGDVT